MKMKIRLLVVLAFTAVLFSFAFKSNASKEDVLNFIKKEYVKSSHSEKLKSIMKSNFDLLFDEIHRIDIHSNQENVYYYAVYGLKDHITAMELFKTSKDNVDNESFPLIQRNENRSSADIYCYWQIEQERCGSEPDWISIRCGLISNGCQSF